METGEEREILPEANVYTGQDWIPLGHLRWSPDGASILCGGFHTVGSYLIDVKTGVFTNIVEFSPRMTIWDTAWSADGKRIFYMCRRQQQEDWFMDIVAYDLATGKERELCPGGGAYSHLAISPDGRELAFYDRDNYTRYIRVISTAGGEAREIYKHREDREHCTFRSWSWTPDGRYLLVRKMKRSPDGSLAGPGEMWRIPVEGGEPQKLFDLKEQPFGWNSTLHPDGQHIAFAKNIGEPVQNELWVMENLLTTFAADK